MRTSVSYLCGFMILSFAAVSCGDRADGKERGDSQTTSNEVSPEVIFENDYVKVVKVSLAPGVSLASHEGEKRLIYSLSDYSIDWVEGGKEEGRKTWKKGDVHFHDAGQHSATNDGKTTAEWLAFIKKQVELPDCDENSVANDVNSIASDFASMIFDNEIFRLTEVNIPVGGEIPMHAGINRIIYALSDYKILYESNKEGKIEKSFQAGDVHWHEACQHALSNTGNTRARFLVVSYKEG